MTCIVCPLGCSMRIEVFEESINVTGNRCSRGKSYAIEEMKQSKRTLTTTVKLEGGNEPVISVKSSKAIPKDRIFEVMEILSDVIVTAPVKIGDIIVADVLNTGIDIIATRRS